MSSPASIRKDSTTNDNSPHPRKLSNNNKPPTSDHLTILHRNTSPTLEQLTVHVKSLAEYVKDLSAYVAAQANNPTTPSNSASNTPSKSKESESPSPSTANDNKPELSNFMTITQLTPLFETQLKTLTAANESLNDCYNLCAQLETTVRAAIETYDRNFGLRVQGLEREVEAVKRGLSIVMLERMEGEGRSAEAGMVSLRALVGAAGPASRGKGRGRKR